MKAKSDCTATYLPGPAPLSVSVESTVRSLFGKAIETAALGAAKELGVTSGTLAIEDSGALDYVVAARVEAALRAAGAAWPEPDHRPASVKASPAPARRDRARRSRLYLPGNHPDLFPNAGLFLSDCLILDLEDSVPLSRKEEARILVRRVLERHRGFFRDSEIIVRINPLSGPFGAADLSELSGCLPHALLLPKCESAEQVAELDRALDALDGPAAGAAGAAGRAGTLIMPLVETARGVLAAAAIASASPRVAALCFGAEDFTADIGARRSAAGTESLYARQAIVLAAKAAGAQALDSVFSDTDDTAGFTAYCTASRGMGFDGVGVIHPRQIPAANSCYSPSPEEVGEARAVIAALRDAEAMGSGVASLDGKMIDAPVARRARRIAGE
jgi:citrate lyase subunit beta/citryl-CoA lyase